jgi:putative addiction module component (TIGR02574 family)
MPIPALDLGKLTRDEKLQLIDQIWDSLDNDPDAFPLTESQRRELDRRLDEMDRGDVAGIPWEQALKEIQSRLKWRG